VLSDRAHANGPAPPQDIRLSSVIYITDATGLDDEDARTRLAHAVLAVAREDSTDAEQLKRDSLQVMALAYREEESDT